MTSPSLVSIASDALSADISPLGAELQALRDADGRDLLWDGDPAWWTGRAPILFPVIGVVAGGVIRVDGTAYPMAKHGFARRRTWAVVAQDAASATFRLEDDAETRAAYPFAFRLDLTFAIHDATLSLVATLHNPAETELPASFGFHPALRWPLPYGREKADHRIVFADPEAETIRRIDGDGLVRPAPEPSPIRDRVLVPDAALFEDDAIILAPVRSRALTFGAPGAPRLEIAWPDMPDLGIWQKPGAPYLCIEPWAGLADPAGYAGAFRDKPGIVIVPPLASHCFTMRIALRADAFG